MRLWIRHELIYRYEPAARGVIHTYHLNPRNHEGQHIVDWRIDVDINCRMKFSEDGFGNLVQAFTADGPIETITVCGEGKIDTYDTAGMVRGALERFPSDLYLRDTPLTHASDDLRLFAEEACSSKVEPLAKLHALLPAVRNVINWQKMTQAGNANNAAEVFALNTGDARGLAHVFVACARHNKIPARFVSGYCLPGEAEAGPLEAGHCWAEAWAEGYGWVGFDPAIGICPRESHIRIACGLDWLGAAPARTARAGAAHETADVTITMTQRRPQSKG